ncbi:glycosyltransferase family 4 protein [Clostridium novyi]
MKKILLISNYIFSYRVKIYNYFYKELEKQGYKFIVMANECQVEDECEFNLILQPFDITTYIRKIQKINPDGVITFLHLKDSITFPVCMFCKLKKIPLIYWGHGIDRNNPKSIKNILYYIIHNMSDAIITYFPNCLEAFKKKNQKKIFIANNSLNYEYFPQKVYSRQFFKKKYNIKEDKIILFVSRIYKEKKLEVLLEGFKNSPYAVVIVGKGLNDNQQNIIKNSKNLYYLGAIYDEYEINCVYANSDLFCIPGANGLSINQALYWGKPVVTLEGKHGPEIYLVKHGENGFIVKSKEELIYKIKYLLDNDQVYRKFSDNCHEVIKEEATMEVMINGFVQALKYIQK